MDKIAVPPWEEASSCLCNPLGLSTDITASRASGNDTTEPKIFVASATMQNLIIPDTKVDLCLKFHEKSIQNFFLIDPTHRCAKRETE